MNSDDEGPSEADIERFSGVTKNCPSCRTELYDDAQVCWKCGMALAGEASPKSWPVWVVLVLVAVIVFGLVGWRLF